MTNKRQVRPHVKKIVNAKLATRVQQSLHEMLLDETTLENRKLPPEAELAEMLGVSRTVVRDVLSDLEREGYITRKRKAGTIINRHVLDVKIRVDQERDFKEFIRAAGMEPQDRYLGSTVETVSRELQEKFGEDQPLDALMVDKLFLADGKPVVFCRDILPVHYIRREYREEDLHVAIFEFAKNFCDMEMEIDLTTIDADVMDEKIAAVFEAKPGDPVLKLFTMAYRGETPVLWSEQFHLPGALPLTILRKKIWSYEK